MHAVFADRRIDDQIQFLILDRILKVRTLLINFIDERAFNTIVLEECFRPLCSNDLKP